MPNIIHYITLALSISHGNIIEEELCLVSLWW